MEEEELPTGLKDTYEVLSASPTCFVLKNGEHESGRLLCSLWGLDSQEDKDEDICFDTLKTMCVPDSFHVWEHSNRCFKHDELADQARQRLAQN
ncbi:hypothetical protein V5799_007976 [Amblyomma americanum]|uniref:Uncharacterized protein n=1 Tax=Amblyomma americanum TaxID=6943 RepID=A0AAQ4FEK9_AMBAM